MSDKKKEGDGEKGVSAMYLILCIIMILLILMLVVNNVVYMRIEVDGTSMDTTLNDGDILVASKLAKPKFDDIVIIDNVKPQGDGFAYLIKRVKAVGGDTFKFTEEGLYRKKANGTEFELVSNAVLGGSNDDGIFILNQEYVVPKGEFLFIGDNNVVSYDSRHYGMTKTENVVGVVAKWAVKIKGTTTFVVKKIIMPIKSIFSGKSCQGKGVNANYKRLFC